MIEAYRRLTHDVVAFDVRLDEPLDFEAGRFACSPCPASRGTAPIPWSTSIARAERLSFVVKKKPDGGGEEWLFRDGIAGMRLGVFGPLGHATSVPASRAHSLHRRWQRHRGHDVDTLARRRGGAFSAWDGHVFFGVRTERDGFFLDELEALRARHPARLSVTIALSDEDVPPSLTARTRASASPGLRPAVAGERMKGRFADVRASSPARRRWSTRLAALAARARLKTDDPLNSSLIEIDRRGATMGQYECHVFPSTSDDTCPEQGDVEGYVKTLRAGVQKAGKQVEVRVDKAVYFSHAATGRCSCSLPTTSGCRVQASDLDGSLASHVLGGSPWSGSAEPGKPRANKVEVDKAPVAPVPAAAAPPRDLEARVPARRGVRRRPEAVRGRRHQRGRRPRRERGLRVPGALRPRGDTARRGCPRRGNADLSRAHVAVRPSHRGPDGDATCG